jgi:hypothetical protein
VSYDHSLPGIGRAGHWASSVLIWSIIAAVALGVVPLPAGTPGAMWLPLALFAIVIGSWLLMRQHDRRLCEHCAQSMPLNAAEVAAAYRYRFATAHANRRTIVSYLVVLIGANVLLVAGGQPGRYLWALIQLSMVYLVLAYSSHRRFQPWCPQCRNDGGGGDSWIDAPEPTPSGGGRIG